MLSTNKSTLSADKIHSSSRGGFSLSSRIRTADNGEWNSVIYLHLRFIKDILQITLKNVFARYW